jgi:hypothetical protein
MISKPLSTLEKMTMWFLLIVLVILGGWLSRMDGGGPPQTPGWVDKALWGVGMGLVVSLGAWVSDSLYRPTGTVIIAVILCSIFSGFAKQVLGHGSYMRMGREPTIEHKRDNEWSAGFLNLVFPDDQDHYWRAFSGMTLNGFMLIAAFIVPFFAVTVDPTVLWALLASPGVALSYEIGWRWTRGLRMSPFAATEIGEIGRGVTVFGSCFLGVAL